MKKNARKPRKRSAGFTLVELIVVIAILAILAGVAVPVYSGYIKKANEASDLLELDTVKTSAVFTYTQRCAMSGAEIGVVSTITVTVDGAADTCTVEATLGDGSTVSMDLSDDSGFLTALNQSGSFSFEFKSGAASATWTRESGKWDFSV